MSNAAENLPPKRWSLADILFELTRPERLMDAPDEAFDPAELVGDLTDIASDVAAIRDALKSKVDGIDHIIGELEAYAERTSARAKAIAKRAQSAARRAERLRAYVLEHMRALGFERLPGHERFIERRRAGMPALNLTRPATAIDLIEHEDLVEVVPVQYVWRAAEVKKAVMAGILKVDWAELKYSERLVFDDVDKAPAQKKRRAKA